MARNNTIKPTKIGSGGIKGTAGFRVSSGNYVRQKAYGFVDSDLDGNGDFNNDFNNDFLIS